MTNTANSTPLSDAELDQRLQARRRREARQDAELYGIADRAGSPELSAAIRAVGDFAPTYRRTGHAHDAAETILMDMRRSSDGQFSDATLATVMAAEARAERIYLRAQAKRQRLGQAVLDVPVSDIGDILLKVDAYARACDSRDITKVAFSVDQEIVLKAVLADLRRLAPRAPAGGQWDAALTAYQHAEAAWKEAADRCTAATDARELMAPMPAELAKGEDEIVTEADIVADDKLSTVERIARLQALYDWRDAYDRASRDLNLDSLDLADSRLWCVMMDAKAQLLHTAPADAAALLAKTRIRLGFPYTTSETDEQMKALAEALSSENTREGCSNAQLLLDLLAICEPASPLLEVGRFDAEAWVREFEANEGCAVTRWGIGMDEPVSEAAAATLKALPAWKRILVAHFARERQPVLDMADDILKHYAGSWITREATQEAMHARWPNAYTDQVRAALALAEERGATFGSDPVEDVESALAAQKLEA